MKFDHLKIVLTVAILFIATHGAGQRYSQPEYKELIKKYQVNKVFSYTFKSKDDSTLSMLDVYNRSGNPVSSTQFDATLNIITAETFIYNDAGHLIKKIITDKEGNKDEYFYNNDNKGKLLSMHVILRDSTKMFSQIYYDEKDRVTKSVLFTENRRSIDTTTTTSYYDEHDRVIKFIIEDKLNGRIDVSYVYGRNGKLRKQVTSYPLSKTTSIYKYDKGYNTEIEYTDVYKNKTETSFSQMIYYNTGFIAESSLYKNGKRISRQKYHYITF